MKMAQTEEVRKQAKAIWADLASEYEPEIYHALLMEMLFHELGEAQKAEDCRLVNQLKDLMHDFRMKKGY